MGAGTRDHDEGGSQHWECSTCTFRNTVSSMNDAMFCSMCDSARSLSYEVSAPTPAETAIPLNAPSASPSSDTDSVETAPQQRQTHQGSGNGNCPFGADHSDGDESGDESECVLCMENANSVELRPCGHQFCAGCIHNWRFATVSKKQQGTTCPNCRSEIESTVAMAKRLPSPVGSKSRRGSMPNAWLRGVENAANPKGHGSVPGARTRAGAGAGAGMRRNNDGSNRTRVGSGSGRANSGRVADVSIRVNTSVLGKVFGKKGANLKRLETFHPQCSIKIFTATTRPATHPPGTIIITGDPSQVESLKKYFAEMSVERAF